MGMEPCFFRDRSVAWHVTNGDTLEVAFGGGFSRVADILRFAARAPFRHGLDENFALSPGTFQHGCIEDRQKGRFRGLARSDGGLILLRGLRRYAKAMG
ncbi:MAG TPA: hypothetical protein VJ942_06640 [Roseovarius sp.]|nr:hypothetical protein [Roseovarius sp.]